MTLLGWENPGTALITGASAGLGAAFARHLADRGFNLVLTARRGDRLKALADSLASEYGIQCRTVAADLSTDGGIAAVCDAVLGIGDLDVLVNNAGFATVGDYADVPMEKSLGMLSVHVSAAMRLVHAALGGMRARKRGAIINVASMAAFVITGGDAVYNATKAFLVAFSESLALENRGAGIRVQALCPGFTRTEFHEVGDLADFDRNTVPRSLWMEADEVVSLSLGALGKKRTTFIPGWKNRLSAWLVRNCGLVRRMLRKAKVQREWPGR